MNYRKLGKTGVEISEVGFGTWQLGGISWVAPSDQECVSVLRRAFDSGINLFDVSPSYGNGRSETLVARAVGDHRNEVFISGKVGVLEDGTYHGFWSERQLLESVEQSLKRLNTSYFDFLALHAPPMDVLKAGYALDLLNRLKEKGMTRFIGVSLEAQPEEALIALRHGIDILQIRFNLLFPEAKRIFTTVAKKGVGLLINSPFGHGYLTGRYRCYEDINEGDYPKGAFRATKPRELVEAMISKANLVQLMGTDNSLSATHAAMKFILAHDQVSSVIPGHRSPQELDDNLAAAAGMTLSTSQFRQAENIFAEI